MVVGIQLAVIVVIGHSRWFYLVGFEIIPPISLILILGDINMGIDELVLNSLNKLDDDKIKTIFANTIGQFCNPTFGALPKKEIEIIIFDSLREIGFLNKEPQIYEVIEKLHITQSKARAIIYNSSLRRYNTDDLDTQLLSILKTPSFYLEKNVVFIELDNPLLIDRLKSIIKSKGSSATDSSFSPNLVKLKEDAFAAIVEYFAEKNNKNIRRELINAGLIDSNTKKIGYVLLKFVDSIKDTSFSKIFQNIIEAKEIFKSNASNLKINKQIKDKK